MDIKTKVELIDAMRADPLARLFGEAGSRPASRWTYTLETNGARLTVSNTAVNAALSNLACVNRHFMCTKYKLK
jgi:hypothetical protein